jgi:hypothetical protein
MFERSDVRWIGVDRLPCQRDGTSDVTALMRGE